jgi:hypothetical protein
MHFRACRERAHSATCPVAAKCDFSGPQDALAVVQPGTAYRATCTGDWGVATVTFTADRGTGRITGTVVFDRSDLDGTFTLDGSIVDQGAGDEGPLAVEYAGGTCRRDDDAPVPEGQECVSIVGALDATFAR